MTFSVMFLTVYVINKVGLGDWTIINDSLYDNSLSATSKYTSVVCLWLINTQRTFLIKCMNLNFNLVECIIKMHIYTKYYSALQRL